MKDLKEEFYTYLCYDQKSDNKFHDPSPKNREHWSRVSKDANNLAEIAIKYLI